MSEPMKLTYFIAAQKGVLVVSFIGPLTKANVHVLEQALFDIKKREATWVILHFKDTFSAFDRVICQPLARIQQLIRTKRAELRIAALHPELQKELDQLGLLRAHEVADNLEQALKAVVAAGVAKAA